MVQPADTDSNLKQIHTAVSNYCADHFKFGFDDVNRVKIHEPSYNADEIYAAVKTLLSTNVTMGDQVKAFERKCADYFQTDHAIMCNSGSSANLLAIAALANPATENYLKPGDEVIMSALSWSTTVWPAVQYGLVPVIVDCDPRTFNIDPQNIAKALSPRTRAIMPVHVFGNACQMDSLLQIAKQNNLRVVEDCCESMGTTFHGVPVGSFGDIGTYSFYFSHHITTLEGGLILTKSYDTGELMRILRSHGWSRESQEHPNYVRKHSTFDPRYLFVNLGYNLRPTELNASMGSIQLDKLEQFVQIRRDHAAFYRQHLQRYSQFIDFQDETPNSRHSWFGFSVVVKQSAPFSRAELTTFLQDNHIETRPIIAGNIAAHPGMKLFPHRIVGPLTNSNFIMNNAFAIGNHQCLDDSGRQYVVDKFSEFFQRYTDC